VSTVPSVLEDRLHPPPTRKLGCSEGAGRNRDTLSSEHLEAFVPLVASYFEVRCVVVNVLDELSLPHSSHEKSVPHRKQHGFDSLVVRYLCIEVHDGTVACLPLARGENMSTPQHVVHGNDPA